MNAGRVAARGSTSKTCRIYQAKRHRINAAFGFHRHDKGFQVAIFKRRPSLEVCGSAPQKARLAGLLRLELKSRGSLLVWFDPDMTWFAGRSGKRGRSDTFSDAAIQFCLMVKGLFGLPLRQATGTVASLLKMAKLDWQVPDFSTLSRRQKDLEVVIPYQPSSAGLNLLVDSTGVKILGEGEWKTKKHGADYRRQWRKVHLGIDAETLEIRAIEVTSNAVGDAPCWKAC